MHTHAYERTCTWGNAHAYICTRHTTGVIRERIFGGKGVKGVADRPAASMWVWVWVCGCGCAGMRTCVRAHVRACMQASMCVCVCVCVKGRERACGCGCACVPTSMRVRKGASMRSRACERAHTDTPAVRCEGVGSSKRVEGAAGTGVKACAACGVCVRGHL